MNTVGHFLLNGPLDSIALCGGICTALAICNYSFDIS